MLVYPAGKLSFLNVDLLDVFFACRYSSTMSELYTGANKMAVAKSYAAGSGARTASTVSTMVGLQQQYTDAVEQCWRKECRNYAFLQAS